MNEQPKIANPVRVEVQFNLMWVRENPLLFWERYTTFFRDYPGTEWEHRSRARIGWLTLIAALAPYA